MHLHPQLNFGGNCEDAFRFYAQHLGGQVTAMIRRSQMPAAPPGDGDPVIHARLQLGDAVVLGNDVPPAVFRQMRSVYLYLSLDTVDEAERVYRLLADGGEVFMPLEETFFARRFAMLRDRFGVSWSIIHERPPA